MRVRTAELLTANEALRNEIVERKEAEAKLQRQHELTRTITDNATIAIFMEDAEHRTTIMNRAAEAMTGFSFAELDGQVLHDKIHHTRPDGTPFPIGECPVMRVVHGQEAFGGHEDVFVRKDGTMFPVRCAFAAPLQGRRADGIVLEVQDITEEKRRRRLCATARRYAALADLVPQLIWTTLPDGGADYLNQRWYDYTGTTAECSLGNGWTRALHAEDRERVQQIWEEATRNGSPLEDDYRIRAADGTYQWFLTRGVPLQGRERPDREVVRRLHQHPRPEAGRGRSASAERRTGIASSRGRPSSRANEFLQEEIKSASGQRRRCGQRRAVPPAR